jgi:hypothetical protein
LVKTDLRLMRDARYATKQAEARSSSNTARGRRVAREDFETRTRSKRRSARSMRAILSSMRRRRRKRLLYQRCPLKRPSARRARLSRRAREPHARWMRALVSRTNTSRRAGSRHSSADKTGRSATDAKSVWTSRT